LKVFESIWKYLKVFESIWKYLKVFESIWKYLDDISFKTVTNWFDQFG
jgi:hypothetical protein